LRGAFEAGVAAHAQEAEAMSVLEEGNQQELQAVMARAKAATTRAAAAEAKLQAVQAALRAAESLAQERGDIAKEIVEEAARVDSLRQEALDRCQALEEKIQRLNKKDGEMRALLEAKVERLQKTNGQVQAELEEGMERERSAAERASRADRSAMEAATKLDTERRMWDEAKTRLKQTVSKLTKRANDAEAALAAAKVELTEKSLQISKGQKVGASKSVGDMGGSAAGVKHEAQLAAVRGELKTTIESMGTKLAEQAQQYEARLREGEERRSEIEAKLLIAQRAADERTALGAQVQSLMSELEEMRDSSAVASSSRLMLSNLQQQCDNAQTELLATAAIVQKLEARVLKAERDAAQAHQALADVRAEAAESCASKEDEVSTRLKQLEESPDNWPPHIRLKVDHWQQQMGELEECIANLQLKRSEQISESESALEFMKERLQAKELERMDAMTASAREMSNLERRLQEATETCMALRVERARLEEELESAQLHIPKQAVTAKAVPMEGLDVLYLKNVVIKFLQATSSGSSSSQALLPVIATLLQFSPDEFKQTQAALFSSMGGIL